MTSPVSNEKASNKSSSESSLGSQISSNPEKDYITLNVPEVKDEIDDESYLQYKTRLDEYSGTVIQDVATVSVKNDLEFYDVDCKKTVISLASGTKFRYLGKELYNGITAYDNGRFGDADSVSEWIQIFVRIFNPNTNPPIWGTEVHRFVIGANEKIGLIIDKLMCEEDVTWDCARLEYFPHPGNIVRLDRNRSVCENGIVNNSILILTHRLKVENNKLKINGK